MNRPNSLKNSCIVLIMAVFSAFGCKQSSSPQRPSPDSGSADIREVGADAATSAATADSTPPTITVAAADSDYRGTVGKDTPVALHLVVDAGVVTGFYVYTQIGQPIELVGTLLDGGISLVETVDGKQTGTMQLRIGPDGLDGEWGGVTAGKPLEMKLYRGRAWTRGELVLGRAEACLANPKCSAAEADRMFVLADKEGGGDCFRFIDGAGTKRDLALARGCLDRNVSTENSRGDSPSLGRAELALMLIEGAGGPKDVGRARTLLADCFQDSTAMGILSYATRKRPSAPDAYKSMCDEIDGTTIVRNECEARRNRNADTRAALSQKAAAVGLDEDGMKLMAAATSAFGAYVDAAGQYVYQVFIDSSIRGEISLNRQRDLKRLRQQDLEDFRSFVAKETSDEDVSAARKAEETAVAAVNLHGADERALLAKSETAYVAYREAELRLYGHVFGPLQGAAMVERAVRVRLDERRAKTCAPPSLH